MPAMNYRPRRIDGRGTPTIPRSPSTREIHDPRADFRFVEDHQRMICASIDVIIQAARLRDGRRITHITEVMGWKR